MYWSESASILSTIGLSALTSRSERVPKILEKRPIASVSFLFPRPENSPWGAAVLMHGSGRLSGPSPALPAGRRGGALARSAAVLRYYTIPSREKKEEIVN